MQTCVTAVGLSRRRYHRTLGGQPNRTQHAFHGLTSHDDFPCSHRHIGWGFSTSLPSIAIGLSAAVSRRKALRGKGALAHTGLRMHTHTQDEPTLVTIGIAPRHPALPLPTRPAAWRVLATMAPAATADAAAPRTAAEGHGSPSRRRRRSRTNKEEESHRMHMEEKQNTHRHNL